MEERNCLWSSAEPPHTTIWRCAIALFRLRACACLVWRSREVQMSVRFSLRFAGRSCGLLLGVPNCPEPGRESVVAIWHSCVMCLAATVCIFKFQRCFISTPSITSPKSRPTTRGRSFLTLTLSLEKPPAPQFVGVAQRLGHGHCRLISACSIRVSHSDYIHIPANMVLKLRLARPATPGGSRKHHPRYNIVLAHARYATRASS